LRKGPLGLTKIKPQTTRRFKIIIKTKNQLKKLSKHISITKEKLYNKEKSIYNINLINKNKNKIYTFNELFWPKLDKYRSKTKTPLKKSNTIT